MLAAAVDGGHPITDWLGQALLVAGSGGMKIAMIHGRSISFFAAPAAALGFALLPGAGAA